MKVPECLTAVYHKASSFYTEYLDPYGYTLREEHFVREVLSGSPITEEHRKLFEQYHLGVPGADFQIVRYAQAIRSISRLSGCVIDLSTPPRFYVDPKK